MLRAEHLTAQRPGGRYRPPDDIAVLARHQAFCPPLPDAALGRAPARLYAAGDLALLRAPARVSIIGARAASAEGCRRAARLARLLAGAGVVIVSGLARGIDRAAHQAAIDAGGATIAVTGVPLDQCYPPEHARLQEEIYTRHLLVSQFPAGTRTRPWCFPARNRTMAMLSHAAVIVEAGDASGSLSHAAETQRLGRPLFLMRSAVENPALTWPAAFLRRGAIVLDDVRQVLDLARAG